MRKTSEKIMFILSVIALCLSIVNLAIVLKPEKTEGQNVQYVLYLGTNDKDTNTPVFSSEEAKAKAADILVAHFGGYTIQEATGGWKDEGTLYQEYTLVIYLSDTTLDEVHAAADDLLQFFNQKSIMIQTCETKTEFYSDSNG